MSAVLKPVIRLNALTKGYQSKRQLLNSLPWPIYVINLVNTTLPSYSLPRSITVTLETYPLYSGYLA